MVKEESDAATKLQATRRGQQERRALKEKKKEEAAAAAAKKKEEAAAAAAKKKEDAAAKLQASRRGQQERRAVKDKKKEAAAAAAAKKKAAAAAAKQESAAATKLQATRRGQQDRRRAVSAPRSALVSPAAEERVPLLALGGSSSYDAPLLSPRDRFRERSARTPMSPRVVSVAEMIADAPTLEKLPEKQREAAYGYVDFIAAEKSDGAFLRPCLLRTIGVCLALGPWANYVSRWSQRIWALVPKNAAMMVFGAALCYFGGTYTASIAAVEAFRTMGGQRASAELARLFEAVERVNEASRRDDERDDDGDGVADVEQIPRAELMRRKLLLTMSTVDEPERIQSAVASTWAALLAVAATTRIEFAATTAMALGIVEMVKPPLVRTATPLTAETLGPSLRHWCRPTIEWSLAILAIALAWQMRLVLSAFYAAVRGGKIFAAGFFGLLVDQARAGVLVCPGLVDEHFEPSESMLDEVVSYIIAAQGFVFQLLQGLVLPFPFNVLLLPLGILEWLIRLQTYSC